MMDEFEEKHRMVQMLMDMLKSSASKEVADGLQKPEGEGDMHGIQVEKVEMLPDHKMDEPTPEHDILPHEMSKGGMAYSEGGEVMAEPKEMPLPMEKEDTEDVSDGEYRDGDSEPSSMFSSFLSRRKKK